MWIGCTLSTQYVKNSGQNTQDSTSYYSICPAHKHQNIPLKKWHIKKNKKETAESAKLLFKRMKEAKEKNQEQISQRCWLSFL